jgi:hypothetical protein
MAPKRITDIDAGLILGETLARWLGMSNRWVCEESGREPGLLSVREGCHEVTS